MTEVEAIQMLIKMRELGITPLEVELFRQKFTPPLIPEIKAEDMVQPFNLDEMSDDEVLYYATPYYDELRAKKELQNQKKELNDE